MALRNLFPGLQPEEQATVSNENFRNIDNRFRTNIVKNIDGTSRIIQGKLPYDGGYGTLYYDNTGTPRYIVGILPDGSLGQQASRPGASVLTAETDDLVFKSDFGATTYYDGTGTPIAVIGNLPDGDIGVVIAKPGENVIDAFS